MAAYISYFAMLLLMMFGPANRHNSNDNTSGVITVLEIMSTLPENLRDKVCFVLFDLEEAGLTVSDREGDAWFYASDRVQNFEELAELFLAEKLPHGAKKIDIEQY